MLQRHFPWIAQQNWQDILFIHTPISQHTLRNFVPFPFKIDTYEGKGWISIVLFKAKKSRLRYMPSWWSYPTFYQMNIRTYVRFGNERGVYFFSINANRLLAAIGGSAVSLPFNKASISINEQNDYFVFSGKGLPYNRTGSVQISYRPQLTTFKPEPSSLAYFLTERYCIWMIRGNHLIKAPINHTSWQLQPAHTSIEKNDQFIFPITNDTFSHYSAFKHTVIYPFEYVGKFRYK